MAVVYKHRKTFGGIEVVGSIDDKQVIIGNKIYPLSRILSVSYDSQRCVIRFCGTKEDLSHIPWKWLLLTWQSTK